MRYEGTLLQSSAFPRLSSSERSFMELKIEYIAVDELNPYENNARKHADEDVGAIIESIKEFGFSDPIGIWHDTIVEGHGRLMAAKQLGMKEVPCIRLDHLTDEQRRAYALAHNRTAELSAWDYELRDLEIASIDIDMSRFGFEQMQTDLDALDSLFAPAEEKETAEPKEIQCPHCGEWFTP